MRITNPAATIASVALLGSLASAQFTTVGPFAGTAGTEGFETQIQTGFPDCILDRVFSKQADLCAPGGAHLTGGWTFSCKINPYAGNRFFGSATTAATYTFDECVTKFGGYFGTNYSSSGPATFEFYDGPNGTGTLLHSDNLDLTPFCSWKWQGWDTGGVLVKSIKVIGSPFGGFVMMDDMEADIVDCGSGPGEAIGFGDTGCPCGNNNDGTLPLGGCQHDEVFNGNGNAGARLDASGIASVVNDTVVLKGTRGQVSNSTLFFQGNNDLSGMGFFLGDGLRIAGGGVIRIQAVATDANGDADTSIGISAKTGVSAGETKYYQWWIRDPQGSPCTNESNTSNGYKITWGT